MSDSQLPWDVRIVHRGLQILAVLTFAAFFIWAVLHLVRMFGQ